MRAPPIVLICILTLSINAKAGCKLAEIAPQRGALAMPGLGTMLLGAADDAAHPAAWQGPLRLERCEIDIGIIEAPFYAAGSGRAFITSYSGALRTVSMVDMKACRIVWKSAPFTGEVRTKDARLVLGGRTVTLNRDCMPAR